MSQGSGCRFLSVPSYPPGAPNRILGYIRRGEGGGGERDRSGRRIFVVRRNKPTALCPCRHHPGLRHGLHGRFDHHGRPCLPSAPISAPASARRNGTSNAYTLTLAAFTLLGGAAGDAYGLRRVFMLGIALFGIASAACGFAWSPESLIIARTIQGVGGALMVPGSLALISAHYPPAIRGRAIGTWAAASSIAPAIGPIIGGRAGRSRFLAGAVPDERADRHRRLVAVPIQGSRRCANGRRADGLDRRRFGRGRSGRARLWADGPGRPRPAYGSTWQSPCHWPERRCWSSS